MTKKLKFGVNMLICIIIMIGFFAVGITGYTTYSDIINDDIKNISKLTATNIYSEIRNELTKPIFVSLTMANDNFLKNWFKEEKSGVDFAKNQKDLQNYLLGIKNKYKYDSVFVISEYSKNYYHFNGINKVINSNSEHDQWYYSFLDSSFTYDLDVDTDEANKDMLSIFINCRIVDENGNVLGVTGVGLELDQVQGMLKSYEDDYGLEALMFSPDGMIQVDSNTEMIEKESVFNINILNKKEKQILNNQGSLEVIPFTEQHLGGYYITRYIEDLDWYLLIKKDTAVLEVSFYQQMFRDFIIYAAVVACVLLIANRIIKQNDMVLRKIAETDLLTKLINRRGFNDCLDQIIADSSSEKPFYVFVFDIDNFKDVNDKYGHLIGDSILRAIAQLASDSFAARGVISRWGGDEFAGYIYGEKEEVLAGVDAFFKQIQDSSEFNQYSTTISMGVTRCHKIDTAETLIYRADKALYEAKGRGKNTYCLI